MTDVLTADQHTELRNQIDELTGVKACKNFYDNDAKFQACLHSLRRSLQEAFAGSPDEARLAVLENWAKKWAKELSLDEPSAWNLNHCRKTALKLLYKVCNEAPPSEDPAEEAVQVDKIRQEFEIRRLNEIMTPCLPMDRANCLFNMRVTSTGEIGLGWYGKGDEEAYQNLKSPPLPLNRSDATINKRLKRLQNALFADDEAVNHWLTIAAPERLMN